MDRVQLEQNVGRELELLRQRVPLLSVTQLSGLLALLRAAAECQRLGPERAQHFFANW